MSVKHKTCQSALNKLFMHPGLWWNLSEIHVYLSYCCTVYSSSFANFGGANGGTSKEDTHPLFWPRPMFFTPLPLLLLPVKNYTEVDAVCRCHVGIWWSWPRRYCCGPCGNACCSAAWHFETFLVPGEAPSGVVKSGGSISQERLRHGALWDMITSPTNEMREASEAGVVFE